MADPSLHSFPWARLRAFLWRFRTLDFAERTLKSTPSPTLVRRRFFGLDAYLDISRSSTHRLLYLDGERHVEERHLLARIVRPGMHVVDVGANIGYYTLLFHRLTGPEGRLTCFEPDADNFVELERNVHRNGLDNVRLVRAAVGNRDGYVPFMSGLNGTVTHLKGPYDQVPIVRLDTAVDRPPDLIKIDVEGYEGEVLEGARSLLSTHRPTLFLELHPWMLHPPHTAESIIALLTDAYSQVEIFATRPDGGLLDKLRGRYLGHESVRSVVGQTDDLIAATRHGEETLWLVCRSDG